MRSYCLHCMTPLGGNSRCPRCGRDRRECTAAPYHLNPGMVLHERYLIGDCIGEGGFGITYIGLDQTLDKCVAVKEFYPSGAANRTAVVSPEVIITQSKREFYNRGVQRFLAEAKNVAAFADEDGIVDVLDYFQANNTAYIVMEYLDGETLKKSVERHGLFRADELIRLMFPVMKSLRTMHADGVIHRDISPDNIMLTKSGKLKLMDFGSARYYTNEDRQMSVVLKQGFAPEEQYRRNGRQGPFTDVYALCATIYTCITGVLPPDSIDRVQYDTLKPPSQLSVRISPAHEAALLHGLEPSAARRCRDMNELMREFSGAAAFSGRITVNADVPHGLYPQPPPWQNGSGQPNAGARNGSRENGGRQSSNAPIIAAIIVTSVAIPALTGVIAAICLYGGDSRPSASSASSSSSSAASVSASSKNTNEEELQRIVETVIIPYYEKDQAVIAGAKPQEGGAYCYVLCDDNHICITNHYGESPRVWYYFDDEHRLYFAYQTTSDNEYRYYVNDDTVIKYTVGKPASTQEKYFLGDSAIDSSVQQIVSDAYGALSETDY